VLALAELGAKVLTVYPVTYIGSDARAQLFNTLRSQKTVSLEGITEMQGNTNVNQLVYLNKNVRKEAVTFHTPSISMEKILPFLNSDILLFNFIAGYDVSLETLQEVRRRTQALIFMDVHSMVLKQKEGAERDFCTVKNWRTWVAQTDIIQMNTTELLYFAQYTERAGHVDFTTVAPLIKQLLGLGPRLVVITAGHRGVFLGTKQHIYFFPQQYKAPVKDTTGCGDIFTASFITKLLVSHDPCIACDYANTLSGLAVREEGIKKCFSLKHSSPLYMVPLPPTTSKALFSL
jgi:sugar/nucleoside kinase (ribokinase family)